MNSNISKYVDLIKLFQIQQISAKQFEQKFLQLFKNDEASVDYPEEIFETLDTLFAAVDEYCDNPQLRLELPHSLDEQGLLDAASSALERLQILSP